MEDKVKKTPINPTPIYVNPDTGIDGKSTEALVSPQSSAAVNKERLIESLAPLLNNIMNGDLDKIQPMVIGVKDGQIIAENCIVDKDGHISLPEISVNTKDDLEKKSKFIRRILTKITPVLHTDIENVTFIALMRKDTAKLKKMMDALQKGETPKLQNRVGCIWLVVGDFEVVL
ncbi:MAG: hypothetical protein U0264_05370 [Candidatus Kapaibacterium sp.]